MAFKLPSFKLPERSGATGGKYGAALRIGGRAPVNRLMQALVVAVGFAVAFLAVTAVLDYRAATHVRHYIDLSGRLVVLTQLLDNEAEQALTGEQAALNALRQSSEEAGQILSALDKGDANVPATSGAARADLDALLPAAQRALLNAQKIEAARAGILAVGQAVKAANETGPLLREASRQLAVSGDVDSVRANRLIVLIERIVKDAGSLSVASITDDQIGELGSNTLEAQKLLAGFEQANPSVAKVVELFEGYRLPVETLLSQAQGLSAAKRATSELLNSTNASRNGPFFTQSRKLANSYGDAILKRTTFYMLVVTGLVLLALLLLLAKVSLDDARRRATESERINKQSKDSILRLMNELSDLADGDLTTTATVSEDITGAIADSVNYTIEELRKLVARITVAAEQMGHATKDAEDVSKGLLEAAQRQVSELREAGESVQLITQSIKEVDFSATQSADVARRTLMVTEQGAQAVRNTISGMDGIREQIQETSKRIKRLGESSQEIGEIVDLISDITEQTNVLALNAAIQAASAGEAGRGFSVVAEEVQRLAERSAEATKQIGALVKTIQGDTQDAVAAMEKSTLGVVEGAKLSDMAGQSLHEIEQVSNELAALINSISVSTQVQTDMAGEVANVMQEVLQITEQTTEGTRLTANSIAQLTTLASDLGSSVAGFKL